MVVVRVKKVMPLMVLGGLLIAGPAYGDVIYFKSGRVVEGRILNQDRVSLVIRTSRGRSVVRKSAVRRIRYGSLTPAESRRMEREKARATARRRRELERQRERERRRRAEQRARADREIARTRGKTGTPNTLGTGASRTDWRALGMSAVLPGWGQYERGRSLQAGLYAGGVLMSGLLAWNAYGEFRSAREAYTNLEAPGLLANSLVADDPLLALAYQIPFDAARRESLRAHARFRAAGLVMMGVYLWNLSEYFLRSGDGRPLSLHGARGEGMSFQIQGDSIARGNERFRVRGGGVNLSWRFSF